MHIASIDDIISDSEYVLNSGIYEFVSTKCMNTSKSMTKIGIIVKFHYSKMLRKRFCILIYFTIRLLIDCKDDSVLELEIVPMAKCVVEYKVLKEK